MQHINVDSYPKASDIIKKLQELIEKYGDTPIEILYDSGHAEFFLTLSEDDWFLDKDNNCIAFFS